MASTGPAGRGTEVRVDPVTGLLYVPGGNPAPDFAKAVRPGDNLFASSIVVLDFTLTLVITQYQPFGFIRR